MHPGTVGGFGTVLTCWDTRLQRRVAIKRMPLVAQGTGAAGTSTVMEALAEARTSSMLAHPNIVTMFDFEADRHWAYLVMEYVDGLTLSELLARVEGGTLTNDECAHLVRSVGNALAFAHENGVLHLDIKPTNIMIERSGTIKLCDFGMATLASATGFGDARGGTVGYMPPEQIEGGARRRAQRHLLARGGGLAGPHGREPLRGAKRGALAQEDREGPQVHPRQARPQPRRHGRRGDVPGAEPQSRGEGPYRRGLQGRALLRAGRRRGGRRVAERTHGARRGRGRGGLPGAALRGAVPLVPLPLAPATRHTRWLLPSSPRRDLGGPGRGRARTGIVEAVAGACLRRPDGGLDPAGRAPRDALPLRQPLRPVHGHGPCPPHGAGAGLPRLVGPRGEKGPARQPDPPPPLPDPEPAGGAPPCDVGPRTAACRPRHGGGLGLRPLPHELVAARLRRARGGARPLRPGPPTQLLAGPGRWRRGCRAGLAARPLEGDSRRPVPGTTACPWRLCRRQGSRRADGKWGHLGGPELAGHRRCGSLLCDFVSCRQAEWPYSRTRGGW
ncbi:hypothetical protein HMPREF1868_01693 [Olsenella sp. DNF00959]|nr:serine/threonine-protein kinase [Olsenella sp. DNF00959]KXB61847.1 hypothetical protein HMPREF1868_01693 [Olsenella sp. DNF00959]